MRLRTRLRSERGLALPLTVLVMATTGALVATAIQFSSSSGRTAQVAKARVSAQSLAEAGIAHAFAVLNNAVDPKTATLLPTNPPTVVSLGGGTATYSGVYDGTNYRWTITSIGAIANPTGGPAITRTLTRTAQVQGLNAGATIGAWSRMYHDNTTTCMTITDVTIPMPVASRGDICLVGSAKITGAETVVDVGDDVRMTSSAYQVSRSAGAGAGWTNPGFVTASDNNRATAVIAGNTQSPNLDATGFGFTIPTGSVITGIHASVERMASGTAIDDEDVFLLKAGAPVGTDHASATDYTTSTSEEIFTYGSSADLWGVAWTAEELNASNFGLRIKTDSDTASSRTASIDHISILIYYTPPPDTSIGTVAQNAEKVNIGGDCT
ncbi:MAG: large repetitive protein, partial [Gaiellaceae bacterium]|nr:large repetitive protein [Gaiellaceae bacterium]